MNLVLQTLIGKKIPITVEANTKIDQLKRQIYHQVGICESVKILQGQNELEPPYSLTYYGLEDGSTLQLLIQPKKNINITVDTIIMGKISMSVEDTMTIKELRRELKTTHQLDVIAELEKLCLEDGSVIEEENLPLHYLGVSEGSNLEMTYGEIIRLRVICTYKKNNTYIVPIKSSDAIVVMKKNIVEQLDIKTDVPETDPVEWNINFVALFLKRGESYLELFRKSQEQQKIIK